MRTPITLGIFAALQIIAGLCSQLIVLRYLGIGWQTDAYIAAQAVPTMITAIVAASLQNLWLPRFSRAAESSSVWKCELGIAQGQTVKLMLVLILPLLVTTGLWVKIAFPGFSVPQQELFFQVCGPLLLAAGFRALEGVLTAALRSREYFILPESLSLTGSLVALVGIAILVPLLGIAVAAWLVLVRNIVVVLILQYVAQFPQIRFRSSNQSRKVAQQIRPLIAGGVFTKSSPLVDRYWGSQGNAGDITVLALAQLAITSLATIIERVLLAQALPRFAKRLKHGGAIELRQAYNACIQKTLVVVIAITIALLMARPVWNFVCAYLLKMTPEVAWQFWLFCFILIPTLYVTIAASASVAVFYSFGETRIPALIGIFGFVTSIILKGVLYYYFGIIGIAVGTSLYLMINMLLHHTYALRRLALSNVDSIN
jgi:putative peptidoglycan lipid II flippase